MALSLAVGIGWNDSQITLSGGSVRADLQYLQIESEELLVTNPPGSPSQSVGSTLSVVRGANGTQPAPHAADTTVAPMYLTLSSSPGGS